MLTTDKKIKFIAFDANESYCNAKVLMIEQNKSDLDIGRALVGLGLARALPITKKTESLTELDQYLRQLKSSENRAKALRKGLWSFKAEHWLVWKVRTTIEKLVFSMKPLEKKIPALVR